MRTTIFILVILLAFLQYRLWVGEGSLAEVNNLKDEIQTLQQEMVGLRKRNDALQAEVEDLRSGQDAIEERARSELGMIKEGEIFYQVVTPSEDKANER
ncbi:MAG: cell division protein FtsB [Candidatus Thiodiazotropha sp. 6PLUC2]